MRSALCFLLLLLAFPRPVALSLSEQRTAVVELCSNFSGFLPGIQQDLLPWSRSGVTEQTRDAAFELARHKWSRLSFALRSGTLYLVDPKGQFEAGARDGDQSWSFMGVYIASLFALSRAHGDLLPDIDFVIDQGDTQFGDTSLLAPGWTDVWTKPQPLIMRFSLRPGSNEVGIPCHHEWDGHLQPMLHSVDAINARHPWTSREAIPHAGYHPYRRAWADQPGTERFGSNGSAINNPRTLLTYPDEWARDAAGRWTNTTSLDHIGYIVHVDGIVASSKVHQALLTGSLVFVEQSGYTTYISRLLRPMVHMVPYWKYRPQELLDGIAWAQAHDDQARAIGQAGQALAASMLSPRGLRCFWLQLFHELAPLLRYDRSWTAPERMMAADAYLEAAKGWRNEKGAPVKSGVVTTAR